MQNKFDEETLKKVLKEAFTETLHEQRELLHEVFAEVLEDVVLTEAIRDGRQTEKVSRDDIFRALEDKGGKPVFRKSFEGDLKKIRDRSVLNHIKQVIEEIETADSLQEINGLKKMSGTSNCSRIRIGSYRVGIAVEGSEVEFVRCLNRREIYQYFPGGGQALVQYPPSN